MHYGTSTQDRQSKQLCPHHTRLQKLEVKHTAGNIYSLLESQQKLFLQSHGINVKSKLIRHVAENYSQQSAEARHKMTQTMLKYHTQSHRQKASRLEDPSEVDVLRPVMLVLGCYTDAAGSKSRARLE